MNGELLIVRRLWPYLREHRLTVILVVVLGVLSSFAEGIGVAMFAPLLQTLMKQDVAADDPVLRLASWVAGLSGDRYRIALLIGIIFVLVVLRNALSYGNACIAAKATAAVGYRLRSRIFNRLLSASYSFWIREGIGKLLDTLGTESWRFSQAVSILLLVISNISVALVLISILLVLSWRLTVLVAAGVVVVSLLLRILSRRIHVLGEGSVRANATLGQRMWDSAAGIRVIQAFRLYRKKQEQFDLESDQVRRICYSQEIAGAASHPLSEILYGSLVLGILLVALQSGTALPSAVVFLLILFRLQPHLNQIDHGRIELAGLLPAVEDVVKLLDGTKPFLPPGTERLDHLRTSIRCEGVSYRYENSDTYALRDVSITMRRGEVTAIVGPSGAGKSTLVYLLARFDDPT
ncbi:MAG: ABC transporter transmembrane domain-containing protein, partial [Bryobacteraceae bacterium]